MTPWILLAALASTVPEASAGSAREEGEATPQNDEFGDDPLQVDELELLDALLGRGSQPTAGQALSVKPPQFDRLENHELSGAVARTVHEARLTYPARATAFNLFGPRLHFIDGIRIPGLRTFDPAFGWLGIDPHFFRTLQEQRPGEGAWGNGAGSLHLVSHTLPKGVGWRSLVLTKARSADRGLGVLARAGKRFGALALEATVSHDDQDPLRTQTGTVSTDIPTAGRRTTVALSADLYGREGEPIGISVRGFFDRFAHRREGAESGPLTLTDQQRQSWLLYGLLRGNLGATSMRVFGGGLGSHRTVAPTTGDPNQDADRHSLQAGADLRVEAWPELTLKAGGTLRTQHESGPGGLQLQALRDAKSRELAVYGGAEVSWGPVQGQAGVRFQNDDRRWRAIEARASRSFDGALNESYLVANLAAQIRVYAPLFWRVLAFHGKQPVRLDDVRNQGNIRVLLPPERTTSLEAGPSIQINQLRVDALSSIRWIHQRLISNPISPRDLEPLPRSRILGTELKARWVATPDLEASALFAYQVARTENGTRDTTKLGPLAAFQVRWTLPNETGFVEGHLKAQSSSGGPFLPNGGTRPGHVRVGFLGRFVLGLGFNLELAVENLFDQEVPRIATPIPNAGIDIRLALSHTAASVP